MPTDNVDNEQINLQAEYDWNLGKVSIRPGVSYQSMSYDDTEYIAEIGNGYLNKERTIDILAGSARVDYRPTDKLRFVAALRAEQYNHPDDIYASWQFVSSYKINDNNIIRAVYSRANQSSFLVNTYSNYTWNVANMPYPRVMQFHGDPNHDLKTMDMIELGYRTRPTKNLLIDIEAFYNVSEGFGALMPTYTDYAIYNPLDVIMGQPAIARPDSINIQYLNLELKSKQLGASISIDWVINEKLVANGHLTIQQTKLDNYQPLNRNDIVGHQAVEAGTNAQIELAAWGQKLVNGEITPGDVPAIIKGTSTSWPATIHNNYEHQSTPSYFGGLSLTYRPIKKLEILPQAYFYGEQVLENQYSTEAIEGKFLLNAKVSYKANSNLTFYINGRNILNMDAREFAFMDEIPGMVLGGLNFKF
ncbi:TonB-dependent receptor domain-containing protein [Carboxylicivirga marina]|uniref:TonB-dependent receptor n=1 Tax=Carboxylicivirga marina TaxID=2800988 RepID=A0ABS1HLI6_9BACT|nr:TonB-dependent receptor [Carboxylicivirga marina]MBK3518549.1 TonB-dependent receptor [Carboxylicivirga marina]